MNRTQRTRLSVLMMLLVVCLTGCTSGTPEEPAQSVDLLRPLVYPASDVQTLAERGLTAETFAARGAGAANNTGNRHANGTGLVISPDFSATVNEQPLPVYAAVVYVADGNQGALHSFAAIDASLENGSPLCLELTVDESISLQTARVFAHTETELSMEQQRIRLTVPTYGNYTVMINESQLHALTLLVRPYVDETAEIAAYQAQYGADRVTVMEPGLHQIDHLTMESDSVLYLKAGAILLPEHTMDIASDADNANQSEVGAMESNALGLNRYPVINGYNGSRMVIAGRGTVDMTQLDWHERRGLVFSLCSQVTVDGVMLINPCEWALITYRCQEVAVTNCAVLGYRTNSDAFAICNSENVTVTDCFARSGDDLFEVKALGGVETAVSRDIVFQRCQAWGSKARCFGITGEVERDISNVLFEDSLVICRDAVWDLNRLGSLVVLREVGTGHISNVTFRNLTIDRDFGRAINVGVYTDGLSEGTMESIRFEQITCSSDEKLQMRQHDGQPFEVTFNRVTVGGTEITADNVGEYVRQDAENLLRFP